ncbi:uncharacterized protein [Physcomitrium patens]|uniref:RRM domain-containing protein n=1 Tax=Physcomitrium patens TaxID=3218 RepID=A0A2K1J4K4_PHYPA|nr:nucleolar protein 12-like [Physcomitrium patens]XP_024401273.1 nucleolar protein 12-like [Physcomitrium patens]PNR36465.1 hypothetical protein PHYPA_022316 [Physcomitrium patens]|eukprot:XP_024401272.1 nucleolar protein 12-like [Physcomitrella patens]
MGDGEGTEVFKNLFGGFSGSLSLFVNNPYKRENDSDAAGAISKSGVISSSRPESLKNGKESSGKEDAKKAVAELITDSGHEKKRKKKSKQENTVEDGNGTSDVPVLVESKKDKNLKKKKGVTALETETPIANLGDVSLNSTPNKHTKELSVASKEERPKRNVCDEEIVEDFEKFFRGVDVKKVKNETSVQGVVSEDPEIDSILHESLQEDTKKQSKRKFDDEDGILLPKKKKEKKTKQELEEEEEKLLRTIFVGNLPTTVKKKQIIREFSQFGKVASARLRSIALVDTKLPRKAAVITGQVNEKRTSQNAYVVFKEQASAKAALAHNMAEFLGKHIRVDMATAPRKDRTPGPDAASEYDRARSLFVGNVPFDVEEEDLYKAFATDNPELDVEAIRVPRDPQTSISKGFAFVLFKTKAGAHAALARKSTKIGERYLRVVRMGTQRPKSLSKPSGQDAGHFKRNTGASKRIPEGAASSGKKGPLPWEGARAAKSDGKPGKGAIGRHDPRRTSQGGANKTGDPGPKMRLTKRPAVLARKQAALFKAGKGPAPPKNVGAKRKNDKNRGRKAKKAK